VESTDVVVVGGGPAGSSCAWKLREAGLDVIVLDRATFPRTKLCAGWITPEAVADLEIDESEYPFSFMTFDALCMHFKKFRFNYRSRQHSIRRYELDDYLLKRSGAKIVQHQVRKIQRSGDSYLIDDKYQCQYLVGAAGTRCPVYREFFRDVNPRASNLQTATYEYEFAYEWDNEECHLWFFNDGLPGYAWYVPKANGHINIGLGGTAEKISLQSKNIQEYWRLFVAMLENTGLVNHDDLRPKGYSYYLRGNVDVVRLDNTYIVGDSIGLATRDMGEGIGPAVKSGLLAADSIANGVDYSVASLEKCSFLNKFFENRLIGSD
jgi:flavin-dependent dehydrogenase